MRIIGGKHSRKVLHPPGNLKVRPTTDLAKEALFSILNHHVDFEGLSVLDLFSGTGNISLEFASRGAALVVSVDSQQRCTAFQEKSRHQLQLQNMRIIRADVFRFLGYCRPGFDVIFADPPYEMSGLEKLPDIIRQRGLLADDGLFVLEHGPTHDFSHLPGFKSVRSYGKVRFTFFDRTGAE